MLVPLAPSVMAAGLLLLVACALTRDINQQLRKPKKIQEAKFGIARVWVFSTLLAGVAFLAVILLPLVSWRNDFDIAIMATMGLCGGMAVYGIGSGMRGVLAPLSTRPKHRLRRRIARNRLWVLFVVMACLAASLMLAWAGILDLVMGT